MDNVIFKATGIVKTFPGVVALDGVSFELCAGEVFGLVGENGAGKSTFIKIMSGVYVPDKGTLEMNGRPVHFRTPRAAFDAGISVVHQELSYIPELTIAENIMQSNYPLKRGGIVDWKAVYANARDALRRIEADLDPRMPIKYCTTAQKQLVEIAKAIYWNAKIIILDEPTSALNTDETEKMLHYIKKLAKEQNVCVIYITHKLDEIFEIADRVAVLRDGRHVATMDIGDTTRDKLIYHMVGRTLDDMYPKLNQTFGETILKVHGLSNDNIHDINFSLRKGEILGVYGMMGSGHIELGQMLFGDTPAKDGYCLINGQKVRIRNPIDALKNGFAYVPSERKSEGLVLEHSVESNIVTVHYQTVRERLVNKRYDAEAAKRWIQRIRIKTPSPKTPVESLSGGNQQKVVLAKWLDVTPKVFIMVDPTRGIDVGSKAEIYELMDSLCAEGMSVIMITSEMPELMAMSDRALIMCNGTIVCEFDRSELDQENIVAAAIGGTNNGANQ